MKFFPRVIMIRMFPLSSSKLLLIIIQQDFASNNNRRNFTRAFFADESKRKRVKITSEQKAL